MSAQINRRGRPFDKATREHFAQLIRAHGMRGASELSGIRVSKSTLGKIAAEFGIELRAGRRSHTSITLPQPQLESAQVKLLAEILLRGPEAVGYRTNHWTGRRICEMVYRTFGVKCLPHHLKDMLADLSLSPAESRVIESAWRRSQRPNASPPNQATSRAA